MRVKQISAPPPQACALSPLLSVSLFLAALEILRRGPITSVELHPEIPGSDAGDANIRLSSRLLDCTTASQKDGTAFLFYVYRRT